MFLKEEEKYKKEERTKVRRESTLTSPGKVYPDLSRAERVDKFLRGVDWLSNNLRMKTVFLD